MAVFVGGSRGFTQYTEGELELMFGGSAVKTAVFVGSATADKRGFTQYTEGELELISQDVITLQRAEAEGKQVSKVIYRFCRSPVSYHPYVLA
jgi:hypothetical protein